MSLAHKDRTFRPDSVKVLRPALAELGATRFADVVAFALHREYGHTHAAVKTVVGLTGATTRAVKNWFDATNGPSGESLIALCRHSDQVLEAVLELAGRAELVKAKDVDGAIEMLRDTLAKLDKLGPS